MIGQKNGNDPNVDRRHCLGRFRLCLCGFAYGAFQDSATSGREVKTFLFLLAALLIGSARLMAEAPDNTDFLLPSIFASNMVLQRDRSIPVWGWATPGERITVTFAGRTARAVAGPDGRWEAALPAQRASRNGRTLTVRAAGGSQRVLENVLVGDVWLLAGQSNMGIPVIETDGGPEAATQADYPWLRVFNQWPFQGASRQRACDVTGGNWLVCSPQNAGSISAVGFYFAQSLQPFVDAPIGLVATAMGGTWIESWIDAETQSPMKEAEFYRQMCADAAFLGEDQYRLPGTLYNGKVAPLQPMALRGAIWYQGEGNGSPPLNAVYETMLTTLIRRWREDFQQPELPFLIVQLPRHQEQGWPLLREAQARVAARLPQTGLAVTIDSGSPTDLHPRDKRIVGERLSVLARSLVFGEKIAGEAPVFLSAERDGDAIVVRFGKIGRGLKSRDGQALREFALDSGDGVFVPAEARITGPDVVRVSAPGVSSPVVVRYAWSAAPEVNLANSDDIPAGPFRSGVGK